MSIVIKVQNVSKQYKLGQVGSGSLNHDLNRLWHKMRGKEDPYLTVGETNDRSKKGTSDYVWALRNIDFNVQAGEVLGIIGKNGAGKSTLLKILSRTTTPSFGSVSMKGRVASLLEVGTGFNPELTGRENIFLNGAIMGMTRKEITKKFDEIIDFAGVERYIDTPVKRYSSGMYVRLGFAVAAHLEPEILIVDEVLAVGDLEFQKKCLGKMRDVSQNEGRTVLFVSHNLTAVKSLCTKALLLQFGELTNYDNVNNVVDEYLMIEPIVNYKRWDFENAPGGQIAKLLYAGVGKLEDVLFIDEPLDIRFKAWIDNKNLKSRVLNFSLVISTIDGTVAFNIGSQLKDITSEFIECIFSIPANFLNDEYYSARILLIENGTSPLFDIRNALQIKMEERNRENLWHGKWLGTVRPINVVNSTFNQLLNE